MSTTPWGQQPTENRPPLMVFPPQPMDLVNADTRDIKIRLSEYQRRAADVASAYEELSSAAKELGQEIERRREGL